MKKFNYLFGWLFCGAALLGFGCDDDKTDVPPPTVTFEIATPEASSNSVSVTVTPSDDKTTYFAGVTDLPTRSLLPKWSHVRISTSVFIWARRMFWQPG